MKNKLLKINPNNIMSVPASQDKKAEELSTEMDHLIEFLGSHTHGPENIIEVNEAKELLDVFKRTSNPNDLCTFDMAIEHLYTILDTMDSTHVVIYNEDKMKEKGKEIK